MFRSEDLDLGHQALSANHSGTMFDKCERIFPVLCRYCSHYIQSANNSLYWIAFRIGTKSYPKKGERSLKLLLKSRKMEPIPKVHLDFAREAKSVSSPIVPWDCFALLLLVITRLHKTLGQKSSHNSIQHRPSPKRPIVATVRGQSWATSGHVQRQERSRVLARIVWRF